METNSPEPKRRRKLDDLDQISLRFSRFVRSILSSNTFWLVVFWMTWEFLRNLDPGWLETHPNFKIWTAPTIAALGVLVKLYQGLTGKS